MGTLAKGLARRLRRWWWARRRVYIVEGVAVGRRGRFETRMGGLIRVGAGTALAHDVDLNASNAGVIQIGTECLIGPHVYIRACSHRFDRLEVPIAQQGHRLGVVWIGDGVWIGAGSIILPNVLIGAQAVIGAGSVVTASVPAGVVAAGNPCRVLSVRTAAP